jgi:acyl-CoA synthetase (AMP-forming)/AMP-acid ligase II
VFDRYLFKPEATAKEFTEDGWFKTGDCVIRTETGDFKILGRLSQDIIKKGGYKLSALEIEDRLLQHTSVAEVAVIGVPDEKYGEEICAFVVGSPGI